MEVQLVAGRDKHCIGAKIVQEDITLRLQIRERIIQRQTDADDQDEVVTTTVHVRKANHEHHNTFML